MLITVQRDCVDLPTVQSIKSGSGVFFLPPVIAASAAASPAHCWMLLDATQQELSVVCSRFWIPRVSQPILAMARGSSKERSTPNISHIYRPVVAILC